MILTWPELFEELYPQRGWAEIAEYQCCQWTACPCLSVDRTMGGGSSALPPLPVRDIR